MADTGVETGISSAAVMRASDAMLRAMGGCQIFLVMPLLAMPNDPSAQLGLVDPGVQQVALSPVVVRSLAVPASGPRRRLEFLISGSAVAAALTSQNAPSADALFEGSLGVVFGNDRFHIESVTPEHFAGAAYLYKVTAVD